MREDRIYSAIVLNEPFADWVKRRIKTIETRMRAFNFEGDIVICCGKSGSKGDNAGKALCIVHLERPRDMKDEDAEAACIENVPGRKAYPLSEWRYFSRDFDFAPCAVQKNFQGIFKIRIPDDVELVNA